MGASAPITVTHQYQSCPSGADAFHTVGEGELSGQGHTRAAGLLTSFRLSLLSWVTLRFDI